MPCPAIISAPRARLTERIAGRSSGLNPTASATEKSRVSMGGRPRNVLAANTTTTITNMTLVKR